MKGEMIMFNSEQGPQNMDVPNENDSINPEINKISTLLELKATENNLEKRFLIPFYIIGFLGFIGILAMYFGWQGYNSHVDLLNKQVSDIVASNNLNVHEKSLLINTLKSSDLYTNNFPNLVFKTGVFFLVVCIMLFSVYIKISSNHKNKSYAFVNNVKWMMLLSYITTLIDDKDIRKELLTISTKVNAADRVKGQDNNK